jgi:hypothetical protein
LYSLSKICVIIKKPQQDCRNNLEKIHKVRTDDGKYNKKNKEKDQKKKTDGRKGTAIEWQNGQ